MTWRVRLRRGLPYLIAIAGGFLLAYMLIAFFVFPAGVIPRDLPVPNVIGLTYPDAVRQLEQVGFKGERGEQRFHNAAPRGSVLDQVPPPGATQLPGARVTLVVSAGQKYGSIPPVIGMTREQAITALETAGFRASDVVERTSNEPRGAVIDSRPRPGTQAPMPSNVSLVVSAGPTMVIIPDVIGRSLEDARILLQQVGLTVGEVSWATGTALTDAAASVVSQSPPAGMEVPMRTRINITAGSRYP